MSTRIKRLENVIIKQFGKQVILRTEEENDDSDVQLIQQDWQDDWKKIFGKEKE